jgi:SAM-dependent methyltransferase
MYSFTMKIPFGLHRRIPLVRRPFWQRDTARAERDAALAERDAALAERDAALAAHHKGGFRQQGEDLSILIETWRKGIGGELKFWDGYFAAKGMPSPHTLGKRLDPELPVQERVAALLPDKPHIRILDVGAGPLTSLGKRYDGTHIEITAMDPLADEYDVILAKHGVVPVVRTLKCFGENLTELFRPNTFDLAFARNSLDHSYDPALIICNMLTVVRQGSFVLLEHHIDEAKRQRYEGLHQWNFSLNQNGNFIVESRRGIINVSQRYADRAVISSEIIRPSVEDESADDWLITRLHKNATL